jgi:FKBP-type peptidyl-prolyl cis-trans isomerase 2
VQGNGPQGRFFATVHSVDGEEVVLDMNHPLAGEDLTFEIEMISIEEASEEEVAPEEIPKLAQWDRSMKKAQLFELAKQQGLSVNTRSTKAQILEALQTS